MTVKRPPVYFLCINIERATITRYVHQPGHWGVLKMQTARIEPPEAVDSLGLCRTELAKFRLEGSM